MARYRAKPSRSRRRRTKYWKNQANRKLRRTGNVYRKGNCHRKELDVRWILD